MRAITLIGVIALIILVIYLNTDALDFLSPYFEKVGIRKAGKGTVTAETSTGTTIRDSNVQGSYTYTETEETIDFQGTSTDLPGVKVGNYEFGLLATRGTSTVSAYEVPALANFVRVLNEPNINYYGGNIGFEDLPDGYRRPYITINYDAIRWARGKFFENEFEILDDLDRDDRSKDFAYSRIIYSIELNQAMEQKFLSSGVTAQTMENIYRYAMPEGPGGTVRTLPEVLTFLGFEEKEPNKFYSPYKFKGIGSSAIWERLYPADYYSLNRYDDAKPFLG